MANCILWREDLEGDFTTPTKVYKLNNGSEEQIWMIGCDVTTNVENEEFEEYIAYNSIVFESLNLNFKRHD